MNSVGILKKSRELISDPSKWTQGVAARYTGGDPCQPHDQEAVCWCALGSVVWSVYSVCDSRVVAVDLSSSLLELLDKESGIPHLEADGSPRPLAAFNDSHTHAEVLALFDKAIAKMEAATC